MNTNLKAILARSGIDPGQTPFAEVCNHQMSIGDCFTAEPIDKYREQYHVFYGYEKELCAITKDLRLRLAETEQAVKKASPSELAGLRAVKKGLAADIEAVTRGFYDSKPEKYVLLYKNILTANTFSNIVKLIPALKGVKQEKLYKIPVFTRNIEKLRDMPAGGAAVVGGPCLFGTDEMLVTITHTGGAEYLFDFNTGKRYNNGGADDMAEHLLAHGQDITNVSFNNQKTRMTLQEYECLSFPMEVAAVLDAPFVFPIPDMSYRKFLDSISVNLPETVRNKAAEDFQHEVYKISDLHIALFEELQKEYGINKYILLHERDTDVLDYFYKQRERYFSGSRFKRLGFASQTGKNEAVYDYVSCLAMPFYFWNAKHIIQVDSIDETNAMEKCAKVHKKEFVLTAVMFPETLSKNGTDTIFNAKREDKIYDR